jgi:hypothetical protein
VLDSSYLLCMLNMTTHLGQAVLLGFAVLPSQAPESILIDTDSATVLPSRLLPKSLLEPGRTRMTHHRSEQEARPKRLGGTLQCERRTPLAPGPVCVTTWPASWPGRAVQRARPATPRRSGLRALHEGRDALERGRMRPVLGLASLPRALAGSAEKRLGLDLTSWSIGQSGHGSLRPHCQRCRGP